MAGARRDAAHCGARDEYLVKNGVSWALRTIVKKNAVLNQGRLARRSKK